jgi:hypothetical protein
MALSPWVGGEEEGKGKMEECLNVHNSNEKSKVQLSLCLTKRYAMKVCGGVEVSIHVFLASALVGGEWSASLRERASLYPLHRRLGGHQSRSGRHAEVKILDYRDSNF